MNLIKPNKLKKGDIITFVAPSGCINKNIVYNAKKYFEQKGYSVKLGQHIFDNNRYLAGDDNVRIKDLETAFLDDQSKAIMCVRGGYGALRIINRINYDIIKKNPKIFCGYSDITALSAMILKRTGLITFSSPMPKGDFQIEDIDDFTEKYFWRTMNNDEIIINSDDLKIYNKGNTSAIMFGGNLATVASLCGQEFVPDDKFIFFCEDLNEPTYKIDRYFRQLLNIDKFKQNISAIILGEFIDIDNNDYFETLIYEIVDELNIPIYGGYKISHGKSKLTIPIGGMANLNNGVIKITY